MKRRLEALRLTLLKPINPAVICVLGFYMVVWGLWIVSPFWSVFGHAQLFVWLARSASEYVWGGIAISCGLIVLRGAMKPVYWNLDIGALVSFLFWLLISILFFIADWQSTGGLSAAAFCVYSGLVWVNVRVNKEYFGYTEY